MIYKVEIEIIQKQLYEFKKEYDHKIQILQDQIKSLKNDLNCTRDVHQWGPITEHEYYKTNFTIVHYSESKCEICGKLNRTNRWKE